jgi:uncharacterized membrane protein
MPAARRPVRARASILPLGFALAGLAVSIYLTIEHYSGSTALACPENATINCAKVTTSTWSRLAGMPVAVLGLVYFVAMTLLVFPPAWRHRSLDPLRVAGAAAGMVMVIYLIWAELFRVDAICLWCTAVHVCTFGLFVAVLWRIGAGPAPAEAGSHRRSAAGRTGHVTPGR